MVQPPSDELGQEEKPLSEEDLTPSNQQESAPDKAALLPAAVAKGQEKAQAAVAHGQEQVQQVVKQVSQQRQPRWSALKRGRLWLVVYVVGLLFVLALALAAYFYPVLPGDLPLTREFQEHTNPVLYNVLYFVSFIGYPVQAAAIALVVLLALWVVHLRSQLLAP
ncbi:MAG TPA: hypothetical protein VH540_09980 [Ktedonobacterales bacterium]|jgi:hypothetical protein